MAGKAQGLKPEPSQPRNGNRILAGLPPDEYDLLAPSSSGGKPHLNSGTIPHK